MKVTIIYDNTVYKKGLLSDWGFSCLVEVKNTPKILFDTGAKGSILLHNMEKLNIEPKDIDEIFISHSHWDHIGGLSDFLKKNKNVKIYAPSSCNISKEKEVKVISVKEPLKIHENIFSTGELKGIEQSMAVKTDKGIVVIAGCSHPGIKNILTASSNYGKIYALIGGLHGFNEFDLLKNLKLVCACHCTQFQSEIKLRYPEKYVSGGAGRVIKI